ncbi:unnamed protein product [Protopolystoma xenopodis]|uniref:Ig-like domain-containing protein n=1 Tax=Protopolystoma xenopodis TaxID=117903 RepID=A0A3S5ANR0_9PLAT|nr:unnamed protein product [Protopolystoma xenopodis]
MCTSPTNYLISNTLTFLQIVNLVPTANETAEPEFTISTFYSPQPFILGDDIRLRCVVTPTPARIQYEWRRNDQVVSRDSEFVIHNIGPDHVGVYRCIALIDGVEWGDELPVPPPSGSQELPDNIEVRPDFILKSVFQPFKVECISLQPGVAPIAQFPGGVAIDSDARFIIRRPDTQRLVIEAYEGLSSVYNGLRIQ